MIGVNVRGTMLCYKYGGQQMIAQGRGGRIIGKIGLRLNLRFLTQFETGASSIVGKRGE